MRNDVNRQWLLSNRPQGMIKAENFRWVEAPLPSVEEGQVLVRNLWLSFDPTQRPWMSMDTYVPMVPLGEVMRAISVGQVVESHRQDYRPGELVQGAFGWQDYVSTDGSGLVPMRKLPSGVPPNLALSLFGITGPTAYFGVLDVGRVKPGEMFVVSGAAGATGSIAGQIAKIMGCKVVGIAGGRAKCEWLTNEVRFDSAIDYRAEDVEARLSVLCPEGIDVFFDNVGGPVLDAVLARLKLKARIVLCGAISRYNDPDPAPGPSNYLNLIIQRARMEGFIVLDYAERFSEAITELSNWLAEGKLKQKEDVAHGLENAPSTLIRLFTGQNFGKQLLKIADPPLPRVD
ncbi:MAG TPA: NADP-dependent oxidoreductase [Blastocatellia bacterium]|nr:NADP-dependent oxidoreductase [Blastocatellia bacterium]